jgi:hypothetical protein
MNRAIGAPALAIRGVALGLDWQAISGASADDRTASEPNTAKLTAPPPQPYIYV